MAIWWGVLPSMIQTAFGSTFDQAMIYTTMGGLEPGER
jgi:multidrug efflux pump subunit AcrB